MDMRQLLEEVVRPTLQHLGRHSVAAEQMIMGTIAQESRGKYLRQLGGGPALGVCQMEPLTHRDIWLNYVRHKAPLREQLLGMVCRSSADSVVTSGWPPNFELIGNLPYAVAMCRVHYLRVSAPLPAAGDVAGLAAYWKAHYNTPAGKGTEAEFIANFPRHLWGL